jgi:hypothetical protein
MRQLLQRNATSRRLLAGETSLPSTTSLPHAGSRAASPLQTPGNVPGHRFTPTSWHRGRTPPTLGARVRHAIGEFARQRNTSVIPRPHPFDHDHEQHPPLRYLAGRCRRRRTRRRQYGQTPDSRRNRRAPRHENRVGLGSSQRRPDPARPPRPIPTLPRVSRRGVASRARDRRIGTSREQAIPTDPAAPTRVAELFPLSPSTPVITRRGFVTGAFATPLSSR